MFEKEITYIAEVTVRLDDEGAVHIVTNGKREDVSLALLLALSSNSSFRDLVLLTLRNSLKLIGDINSDLWKQV